ncbi:MAG: IS630 family transposase [Nitrososphaerota archaeon]|jgi:transposase|nr:IS630 family transposase [Nitrososphaerota archaeon]
MEKLANSFAKFGFEKTFFLDESSLNLAYTRLYGWAKANQRVREGLADVRFKRQSIVSTIRLDGSQVPLVFEGTLNGVLLVEYVRKCLVPSLGQGDIVVWDNSAVHKSKLVVLALKECGVRVVCLPSCLPDFNPIELLWAYLKAGLRKLKARTVDTLVTAIHSVLSSVSPNLIAAWTKHCGYKQ